MALFIDARYILKLELFTELHQDATDELIDLKKINWILLTTLNF